MAMLGLGFVLATWIILAYRLLPLFFYVIKAISTIYELQAAHALSSDLFPLGDAEGAEGVKIVEAGRQST